MKPVSTILCENGSTGTIGTSWEKVFYIEYYYIVRNSQYYWKQQIITTYNEASFDREYESKWSGTVEDAFFSSEIFERNRILKQPEYEASGRSNKNSFYILSCDVGRKGQIHALVKSL